MRKAQSRLLGNGEVEAAGLTPHVPARIFAVLEQSLAQSVTRRRSARYAARRRQRWLHALGWGGLGLVFLAAAAGFALGRGWLNKRAYTETSLPAAVTEEQSAEALRLVDQAVSARHEERLQGAVNAISEARRLNPDAPGLDIFVGEVAWEQRDAETVRRAAREALDRGNDESSAKLLLALEKWMTRLGGDTAQVGGTVRQLLAEAEEESPSNAAPFFFHGEVSRMLGDSAEVCGPEDNCRFAVASAGALEQRLLARDQAAACCSRGIGSRTTGDCARAFRSSQSISPCAQKLFCRL